MRLLPRTIAGRVALATAVGLAIGLLSAAIAAPLGASGLVLAAVVAALLALPVAVLFGGDLAAAVQRLTERASVGAVSPAGWSVSATVEIERLAVSLRAMSAAAAERSAAAEADRDRLATLLREMGDAVLIVAVDDRVTLTNPAAERLLGARSPMGRRLAEVAREPELIEAIETARRDGSAEATIERADPRRSVSVAARRLPGADVLVTAHDLTELRRLETVRRDFVANVSHELRTPLASLKAMAEALEGGALDRRDDARDFVRRMHREIDDLTQLVTELLTLSRVEAGAAELRREPIAPAELLSAAVARFGPLADRAGVALTADPTNAPDVLADRERIDTVLANLVHNAVKFTPGGGRIALSARPEGDVVRFEVRDTGEGVERGDLERVFERFYKTERSRSTAGTGLGLAIARHVVLAHGGRIRAESEGPGHGATFSFTLPIATIR